jgi:3-dehydrosphinganine reductase
LKNYLCIPTGGMMSFENKTAVITGGSSGIGLALARQLTAQGAHVWLMARDAARLEAAASEIKSITPSSPPVRTLSIDVADFNQVEQAAARIIKEAGAPDFLINSAGVVHPGRFMDLDLEKFRWMMEINYFGTLHTIKAFLPGMLGRGTGHLVNISSGAGFVGIYGYSAYSSSKYALRGLSDVLRAELKPEGIRVSIVFPPDTDTPQLAYENQFKPVETRAIAGTAKSMPADKVARSIIQGIARGNYLILPGDTGLLFRAQNILGGLIYPLMDFMIRQAQNKRDK